MFKLKIGEKVKVNGLWVEVTHVRDVLGARWGAYFGNYDYAGDAENGSKVLFNEEHVDGVVIRRPVKLFKAPEEINIDFWFDNHTPMPFRNLAEHLISRLSENLDIPKHMLHGTSKKHERKKSLKECETFEERKTRKADTDKDSVLTYQCGKCNVFQKFIDHKQYLNADNCLSCGAPLRHAGLYNPTVAEDFEELELSDAPSDIDTDNVCEIDQDKDEDINTILNEFRRAVEGRLFLKIEKARIANIERILGEEYRSKITQTIEAEEAKISSLKEKIINICEDNNPNPLDNIGVELKAKTAIYVPHIPLEGDFYNYRNDLIEIYKIAGNHLIASAAFLHKDYRLISVQDLIENGEWIKERSEALAIADIIEQVKNSQGGN
jgi:hypothetical protein